MNRIVVSLVLCLAAIATACGSTTNWSGTAVAADTKGGVDTSLAADTGASDDAAAGKDAAPTDTMSLTDVAADTGMPMDTAIAVDTQAPKDTAAPVDTAVSTDTGASGACVNDADKTILASGTVEKATTDCAMKSFGDAAKATTCLKAATGLSDGCSTCFAGILSCTFKNCLTSCMSGKSPACDQCMIDKGCNATFTDCAGVSP